jgi:hypothetical protein
VGIVVPTHVHLVALPAALIEINPRWRGYEYFVVRDEIVIVDDDRRIVSVVDAGSSGARMGGGGGGGGSAGVAVMDLSPAEIREIQLVLIQRGYQLEADGILGPRTREVLIQFQRKEGLQATGQFDSRTITALGVNVRGGQRDGQGSMPTTGQGPSDRNQGQGTTGQGNGMGGQGRDMPAAQGGGAQNNQGAGGSRNEMGNRPNAQPQNRPATGAPAQGGQSGGSSSGGSSQ